MQTVLLSINSNVAMGQVIIAVTALKKPQTLSHSSEVSRGERLYSRMFAARTIPFGFATAIFPFYPSGLSAAWILLSAAVVQVFNVLIGFVRKELPQIILASFAVIVHALCAASILARS